MRLASKRPHFCPKRFKRLGRKIRAWMNEYDPRRDDETATSFAERIDVQVRTALR
jgi:hypothetical protein